MMHRDCMEYMATLPDKAFDLAIVDPPYGIGAGAESFRNGTSKGSKSVYKIHDWDNSIPTKEYFNELKRVSKNQIIWGANHFVEHLSDSSGWVFWDKGTGDNSYSDGELAYSSFDKAMKKVFISWVGANAKDTIERLHPSQKPVALYKWLLSRYAKPGDKILDTHGGSGSICIACHDLGYDLTWMELDADYYKAACERYQNHAKQIDLFSPEEIRQPVQGELL